MRHVVMVVHDLKARAFIVPFYVPTAAVGIRTFADCANDPNHAFFRNPADYGLFELGTFDDVSGTFECAAVPVTHGLAASYQTGGLSTFHGQAAVQKLRKEA